jgi:hypothetical protein
MRAIRKELRKVNGVAHFRKIVLVLSGVSGTQTWKSRPSNTLFARPIVKMHGGELAEHTVGESS